MTVARIADHDGPEPDRVDAERLLRTNGGRLYAAALRLLGRADAAKAAVAEACRAVFADGEGASAELLHRQVLRAAVRRLPARRPTSPLAVDELLPAFADDGHHRSAVPAWDGTCDRLLHSRDGAALLLGRIDLLPDDHRTLLLLADVEGLGVAPAAALLGIRTDRAKARLRRARQAVRELLARVLTSRSEAAATWPGPAGSSAGAPA
ncbi:MAG TPA: sigma factor-like helix-turn-helix DNA-binding protein [Planctomycetota bacterium]